MSPSPALPRMIGLEELITCDMLLGLIADMDRLAQEGRQTDAASTLAVVVTSAAAIRSGIREVIAAKRQAAQALDLAQRVPAPRLVCGAFMGVPNPHPHAPNSEQSNTSDQPSPSVA